MEKNHEREEKLWLISRIMMAHTMRSPNLSEEALGDKFSRLYEMSNEALIHYAKLQKINLKEKPELNMKV